MHTILGAGGAIGVELVSELAARGRRIRLVSRNPKSDAGPDQVVSADLANLDQTIKAVAGSQVAYLVVGLKYDVRIWREQRRQSAAVCCRGVDRSIRVSV